MVIAWGVGVAVTLGAWVAGFALGPVRMDRFMTMRSLQGVERRIELRFPPGTQLQQVRYTSRNWKHENANLWAVMTMPPQQARAFLAGPPFAGEPSEERRPNDEDGAWAGVPGWHPDTAHSFVCTSAPHWGPFHSVSVLADLDKPGIATVYLMWTLR